jgi:hypothetical protein
VRPPLERDPASLVIFLVCVAVLLVLIGIGVATTDSQQFSPTNTEETK